MPSCASIRLVCFDGNSMWLMLALGSVGCVIFGKAGPLGSAPETCAAIASASARDKSPTSAITTLPDA
ncbi:hypothetical protein D3C84_1149240 [compost metagenome]